MNALLGTRHAALVLDAADIDPLSARFAIDPPSFVNVDPGALQGLLERSDAAVGRGTRPSSRSTGPERILLPGEGFPPALVAPGAAWASADALVFDEVLAGEGTGVAEALEAAFEAGGIRAVDGLEDLLVDPNAPFGPFDTPIARAGCPRPACDCPKGASAGRFSPDGTG